MLDDSTVNGRYLVDDVAAAVRVRGPGGSQILAIDPAGNFIELSQPAAGRP